MSKMWTLFGWRAYLVSSRVPSNLDHVTIEGENFDYIFLCCTTKDVDQYGEEIFFYRAVPRSEKKDILRRFPNALGIDRLRV